MCNHAVESYGALEGEEVGDDGVVRDDRVAHDQVEEATQRATSLLDELLASCKRKD